MTAYNAALYYNGAVPWNGADNQQQEGGGNASHSYRYSTPKLHTKDYYELATQLEEIKQKIAAAEKKQTPAQQATHAADEQAALEAIRLQEEINVLRTKRARLMRFMDDEQALAAILMSKGVFH